VNLGLVTGLADYDSTLNKTAAIAAAAVAAAFVAWLVSTRILRLETRLRIALPHLHCRGVRGLDRDGQSLQGWIVPASWIEFNTYAEFMQTRDEGAVRWPCVHCHLISVAPEGKLNSTSLVCALAHPLRWLWQHEREFANRIRPRE
jgi:hypothetical protein